MKQRGTETERNRDREKHTEIEGECVNCSLWCSQGQSEWVCCLSSVVAGRHCHWSRASESELYGSELSYLPLIV